VPSVELPRRRPRRAERGTMSSFIARHPIWSLIILILIAVVLFLILAVWPPELEQVLGRKRIFLSALLNGITLGGLYFLVASGFTLIFGLMRNVNLAHGSLYLLGGYIGFEIASRTGGWIFSLIVAFVIVALIGIILQFTIFRWMEGQDLRQTLVTIAISIILADIMLWTWGGDYYQVPMPSWLSGPIQVPLITAVRGDGEAVYLQYPLVRLVIMAGAVVIGVLMWLALNRTKVGMLIRAGVDDRDMLSASGIRVQLVFLLVFAFGAGLAGFTGVVGGTFQSLQPGEDIKILLASLVVVIVGGMGSIPGAALGAVLIGVADQFGTVYMPTYAVVLTFVIMVVVLALRPQGLLRGH
jgi:branched-chain amino acid transport system permease protein